MVYKMIALLYKGIINGNVVFQGKVLNIYPTYILIERLNPSSTLSSQFCVKCYGFSHV